MADEEHAQSSRKRVADKQINKDHPEPDDDSADEETGTFKKASEEVMATRRIVKVRRQQPAPAPSSNPFSSIRFTPSDSSVQASIPVSVPPPSDVGMANVKDSCSSEKGNEGSNGTGKDVLSTEDKNTGSIEVAEIQKDEAALKESDGKEEDTVDGTVEDKVVVGGPKEDTSKTSGIEGDTKDGDAEEKKAVDEAGVEDKIAKDDAEKKVEAESGTKDGAPEQKDDDKPAPLFSFKNLSSGQNAFTGLAGTGFSVSSFSFGSGSKESSDAPLFGFQHAHLRKTFIKNLKPSCLPQMAKESLLILLLMVVAANMAAASVTTRKLMFLVQPQPNQLTYHNGAVLQGDIPVSVIWYGRFTAAQKAVISDFLVSLSAAPQSSPAPSVSQWWSSIHQLYLSKAAAVGTSGGHGSGAANIARVVLSGQVSDEACSLGKSLKLSQLPVLAARARPAKGGIALVLTSQDVAVEGFCMSRCGRHGPVDAKAGTAYVWAGNSAAQCPGQCAWPFHQPAYGPQTPPLAPPNGDVGMDGLVINVASMVAGAVTNPFGDGFYQGDRAAPLEAATACPGVYGKGAYPGYAGQLLVDMATGASYNANGAHGRKYLLPALFDPATSACSTLV